MVAYAKVYASSGVDIRRLCRPTNGSKISVAEAAHFSGVAERYALAIFELAEEAKALDAVMNDFSALRDMVHESADLARLVRAPIFSRNVQKKGMLALLEKAEAQQLTRQFIMLLASKRRLFTLLDVIKAFEGLLARKNGEIDAEVSSARPLADAEIASLKTTLKNQLGREPRLVTTVDPTLMGGLVVKVGSRMIDSSLRTKLNAIRTAMRGA